MNEPSEPSSLRPTLLGSVEAIITMFLILVGTGFDELWRRDAPMFEKGLHLVSFGPVSMYKGRLLFFALMTVLLRFALGCRNHLTTTYGGRSIRKTRLLLDLAFLMVYGLFLRLAASQQDVRGFFACLAVMFCVSITWCLMLGRPGPERSLESNWKFWIGTDLVSAVACLCATVWISPNAPRWTWIAVVTGALLIAAWDIGAQVRALENIENGLVPRKRIAYAWPLPRRG